MDDIKIIKKLLEEGKIPYTNELDEEIHLESIQLVMLVALIEDEYDIEIPDDYLEVEQINSVQKILNIINEIKSVE